jgi:hypothetical protein
MFNRNYAYNYPSLTPRQQAARERNLKAQATRKANADAKRKVFLSNEANMQLMADLHQYAPKNSFAQSMIDAVNIYGSLTDNQLAAAVRMVERQKAQAAERRAENLKLAEQSDHVGEVGQRRDFSLTLDRVFGFHGNFGYTYGHMLHDADGNVFVYFGNRLSGQIYDVEVGDRVDVKATIKRHDNRDGVNQTVLSRPKVLDVHPANPREPNDDLTADIQSAEG